MARDNEKSSHGRPILPLESDADPPYIFVKLQEGDLDKGLVKIRRFDLRLINYQDPFGSLIVIDEYGLYDDDSRLADFGIEGFLLGLTTFMEAVNSLLDSCKTLNNSKNVETSFLVKCDSKNLNYSLKELGVGTSLRLLCLVLCEATKIQLFARMLDSAFKSRSDFPMSSWLFGVINDWEFYSKELLRIYLHSDTAECNFYLPFEDNDWHDGRLMIGSNCQDVARCLGILRAVPPTPEPMKVDYLSGTTLVEVYSVCVYVNGGQSISVYGSIIVHNDPHKFSIYDRDSTECESVEPHGTLSLQDPNSFVTVGAAVRIELNLMGGSDNIEISRGKLSWNGNLLDDMYDCRISTMVRGKDGCAIVYYTVFSYAILAVVEATLLIKGHSHDSDDICVCGRLSARYGDLSYAADFHEKYHQTILFDKPVSKKEVSALSCTLEAGTCKRVKVGEAIKLSRSRVAVHVQSSLIIKADLKNCDGKPIVTGSMEWRPEELGEFVRTMEGHSDDSHLLQVKVKWIHESE